ncbi:MAG: hypothetical protein IT489_03195 [Gammaproteobacteria bacterium]|nr:hypothetical protein [Gammaproteobacteria bacterium]
MKRQIARDLEGQRWTVRHPGDPRSLTVDVICAWDRGDIPEMVMSNSSGPKDYLKNVIYSAFASCSAIETIAMVRSRGPLFLLLRTGSDWRDVTARPVTVQPIRAAA